MGKAGLESAMSLNSQDSMTQKILGSQQVSTVSYLILTKILNSQGILL